MFIDLSCSEEEGKYICTNYKKKFKIRDEEDEIQIEKGISPSSFSGEIKFKNEFEKKPSVFSQPTVDEKYRTTNFNVYDVSKKGFQYQKYLIAADEETGFTGMGKDDQHTFQWMAL